MSRLNKQAIDPAAAHEMSESPEAEMAEHALGGPGEEHETHAGGEDEIEHLLSQLSPEEIQQLATEVAAEMQGHGGGEAGEEENVPELAEAIQAHLAQNPEASPEMSSPEKAAALDFVKSASYIEGFLEQALDRGVGIKQAVDLYDQALATTISQLKEAELHGGQHKLDVNKDGKITGEDLAKLRKHKKSEPAKEEHDKTAAYYEGFFKRASEYGFSEQEALNILENLN